MAGVTEADDLTVVEEVVFAERGDAAAGGPETGVATRLHRHFDSGRHDARQGAAVRHDDLLFARALQDLVHGRVDALRLRRLGLCALHTFVVFHPLPDSRRGTKRRPSHSCDFPSASP